MKKPRSVRKEPAARKERNVSSIKLNARMRKKILSDLGVDAPIDWVPDTIFVNRIPHQDLGITKLVRPNAWVIVMV